MKATLFHIAPAEAHERIASMGLMMYQENGVSFAEDYNNPAGAAVYMWDRWPENQIASYARDAEIWAITMDPAQLMRDPSNLGALGAVYAKRDLSHAEAIIECLGPASEAIEHLQVRHLSHADTALAYNFHHAEDYAKSMAIENEQLQFAWISRWDEDDEAYRPCFPIAVTCDASFGEQDDEAHLLRLVHSPYGCLTIRDLVTYCLNPGWSSVYIWEWIVAPSRELVAGV